MTVEEIKQALQDLLDDKPSRHLAEIEGRDFYDGALALWAVEDVVPALRKILES